MSDMTNEQKTFHNAAIEQAAALFDEKAALHSRGALWIGPERQRYEGPRVGGVQMTAMNGPAISHDEALFNAAAIRGLKV